MQKTAGHITVIEKFNRMVNKFIRIEKKPRDYGTGALLYPSGIHLVESIGRDAGINVTELAAIHGISRAAVSQKLRKLEQKGLVERFKDSANDKNVLLKLKREGRTAFRGHEKFHARMDTALLQRMDELPPEYRER